MRKIFGPVLVAILMAAFLAVPANARPGTLLISLGGWQEPTLVAEGWLKASGWAKPGDKVINFDYMFDRGTELEASQEALPRLVNLVNRECFKGTHCELHGFSRGADVLVWIENQMHWPVPGLDVILHEPGAGDTGAVHSVFLHDDPLWTPLFEKFQWAFGTPNLDAPLPTANTQVYYNNGSLFSNVTPVCRDLPAALTMAAQLPFWHSIVMPREGDYRVWTGAAGAINYEYGSVYPSGADVKSCPA